MLDRLWRAVRGEPAGPATDAARKGAPTAEQAFESLRRGDLPRARDEALAALASKPDSAPALFVLGMVEHAQGETGAALECFRRVCTLQPDHFDAALKAAMLLRDSDRVDLSLPYFDTACALREDATTRNERAIAWLAAGKLGRAEADLRTALQQEPAFAPAYVNLALVCRQTGRSEEAFGALEKALTIDPELLEARSNLAALWRERDQPGQALAELERVLQRAPDHAAAIALKGLLLRESGDAEAAAELLSKRSDPEALCNLGLALQDLGRFDAAHEAFERAAASGNRTSEAQFNRGLLRLLRGDFAAGWRDYEHRLSLAEAPPRLGALPRWDGGALGGRRLLVHAEQGLGDEIMFASCVPDLLRCGGTVVLECDQRLRTLFSRSFPGLETLERVRGASRDQPDAASRADVEIAAGSLPGLFRTAASSFPGEPYLRADPALAPLHQARPGGKRVGIAWRGGVARTRQRTRSLALEDIALRLARPGIELVCLQHDASAAERARVQALNAGGVPGGTPVQVIRADESMDRTASVLASLDLVVTVCQTLVHLSGALGRPTWVLTPFVPEWRYGAAGEAMPWFGSVRLFRQSAYGQWSDPLGRLGEAFAAWADAGVGQ